MTPRRLTGTIKTNTSPHLASAGSMVKLFQYPTIRTLARRLDGAATTTADAAATADAATDPATSERRTTGQNRLRRLASRRDPPGG